MKDRGGRLDADQVRLDSRMPGMPSMNMPEMRNALTLTRARDGVYRVYSPFAMAGRWDAVVAVRRGGADAGGKAFSLLVK